MFLGVLNQKEKENFLELAFHIAHCDSDFSSYEKIWISRLRRELYLENYEIQSKSLDEILEELSASSFIIKTSILLEILELMLTDKTYHVKEKEAVKKLCESWDISDEQFENIIFWLKDKNLAKS